MGTGWRLGRTRVATMGVIARGRSRGKGALPGAITQVIPGPSMRIRFTGKGCTPGRMEELLTANGRITKCMVMEYSNGLMAGITRGNTSRIRSTDSGNSIGRINGRTGETGRMGSSMEEGLTSRRMVLSEPVSGKMDTAKIGTTRTHSLKMPEGIIIRNRRGNRGD